MKPCTEGSQDHLTASGDCHLSGGSTRHVSAFILNSSFHSSDMDCFCLIQQPLRCSPFLPDQRPLPGFYGTPGDKTSRIRTGASLGWFQTSRFSVIIAAFTYTGAQRKDSGFLERIRPLNSGLRYQTPALCKYPPSSNNSILNRHG